MAPLVVSGNLRLPTGKWSPATRQKNRHRRRWRLRGAVGGCHDRDPRPGGRGDSRRTGNPRSGVRLGTPLAPPGESLRPNRENSRSEKRCIEHEGLMRVRLQPSPNPATTGGDHGVLSTSSRRYSPMLSSTYSVLRSVVKTLYSAAPRFRSTVTRKRSSATSFLSVSTGVSLASPPLTAKTPS